MPLWINELTSSDLLDKLRLPLFLACFKRASDTKEVFVLAADFINPGLGLPLGLGLALRIAIIP